MSVAEGFGPVPQPDSPIPGQEYLKAVWEFAGDALALSNRQGIVLMANSAYLQLYGYSADEIIGHSFAIIFPEALRQWAVEEYHKTFEAPSIAPAVESTVVRKDGTERIVEARYTFVMQGSERTAMISIVRDITDIRRAEADLRASQETFRSAFEFAPIGIALLGLDGHYLQANPAFRDFTGYSEEELRKLSFEALAHPEDLPGDIEALSKLRTGELGSYRMERRYIRRDGQVVWALLSVSLIRDAEGNPLHYIRQTENITERKRAEANETQARLEAEKAVLDRDRLLSIVAHDLRNPLAAIKGTAQLLSRFLRPSKQTLDVERIKKHVQQIERSAGSMNAIVDEILDFSKLEAGLPLELGNRTTDLVQLVRRVVEGHRQGSPHHDIVFASTTPQLISEWDPNRLERVYSNLIENAIKYSRPGSAVKVEIYCERNDKAQGGEPGWVRVRVTDQGIGIPTSDLPHIFEWYRRASNANEWAGGAGIGLAGAQQIIEQYGGMITVESTEGEGSAFTVSLPFDGELPG